MKLGFTSQSKYNDIGYKFAFNVGRWKEAGVFRRLSFKVIKGYRTNKIMIKIPNNFFFSYKLFERLTFYSLQKTVVSSPSVVYERNPFLFKYLWNVIKNNFQLTDFLQAWNELERRLVGISNDESQRFEDGKQNCLKVIVWNACMLM